MQKKTQKSELEELRIIRNELDHENRILKRRIKHLKNMLNHLLRFIGEYNEIYKEELLFEVQKRVDEELKLIEEELKGG